jgi:hypothetical protein
VASVVGLVLVREARSHDALIGADAGEGQEMRQHGRNRPTNLKNAQVIDRPIRKVAKTCVLDRSTSL